MALKSEKSLQATNPFTGEPALIKRATVWVVDPSRGDLYVITLPERDILVQLTDGGIANHPENVINEEVPVMFDMMDKVIALPIEGGYGWKPCKRLRD
jgi:hypothetical protein